MLNKRAFLLFVVLFGLAVLNPSADHAQNLGNRVLIKESAALFVTDPGGVSRRKIAEKAWAATFSPDGNLVAYADTKGVYVFSLLDGHSVTVGHVTEGGVDSIAWSPDQKFLAYDVEVRMKSWDLFLASYPPSGDAPRNLGHWYETMSFSPDGKFIVHPSFGPEVPNLLETVNVETGQRETIYKATTVVWDAKYAPDGSSIAFMMTDPEERRQ
jgi:WD40 repeat protein